MPSPKWVLHRSQFPGEIILDGREQYSFGRAKENDHILLSLFVSRKHCIFQSDGTNLSVIDLNSANGTFVNDCRINAHEAVTLKESDIIGFGVTNVESIEYFVFTLKKVNQHVKVETDLDHDIKESTAKKEPVKDSKKQEESFSFEGSEIEVLSSKIVFQPIEVIDLSDDEKSENIQSSLPVPTSKRLSCNTSDCTNKNVQEQNEYKKKEKNKCEIYNPKLLEKTLAASESLLDDNVSNVSEGIHSAKSTNVVASIKKESSDSSDDDTSVLIFSDRRDNDVKKTILPSSNESEISKIRRSSNSLLTSTRFEINHKKPLEFTSSKSETINDQKKESHNLNNNNVFPVTTKDSDNASSNSNLLIVPSSIKKEPFNSAGNKNNAEVINRNSPKDVSHGSLSGLNTNHEGNSNIFRVKTEPDISLSTSKNNDLQENLEDPGQWFRTELLPYLDSLDRSKHQSLAVSHGETSNSKRKNNEVSQGETSKKKMKLSVSEENEIILNKIPTVVVEKLNLNKLDKNIIAGNGEDTRKVGNVGRNLIEDHHSSRSSSPHDTRHHDSDLDSSKSQIFNYSQSDDAVIVIDDDEDDDIFFINKSPLKEQRTEDIFIKQEVFEDGIEEEDEDDIIVIEWVSKLSQNLNIKEEKDTDYPDQGNTVADYPDQGNTVADYPDQSNTVTDYPDQGNTVTDSSKKPSKRLSLRSDSFDDDLNWDNGNDTYLHSECYKPDTPLNKNDGDIETLLNDASSSKTTMAADAKNSGVEDIPSEKDFQQNFYPKSVSNKIAEYTLTENSSSIRKSSLNKTTLLCSALPLKQRRSKSDHNLIQKTKSPRKKSHDNERHQGNPKRKTNFSESAAHKSKTCHTQKIKNLTSTKDDEKSIDKEDRKKKLRALAEKEKEKGSKSESRPTLVAKTSVPVKNTKSSRADKLLEQFVVPQHNSDSKSSEVSKKEKSSCKTTKINSSPKKLSKEPSKESKNSLTSSHNCDLSSAKHLDIPLQKWKSVDHKELHGNSSSDSGAFDHCKSSNQQMDVVQKIRKLSFKDLPKIPKRKDKSENPLHSGITQVANVPKTDKPLKNKFVPKEQHKPLQSCFRLLGSPRKVKTVRFAAEDNLCSVRSFPVDHNNKLRPVDAKDAPVKHAAVQEARCLFEVSQKSLEKTVSQILLMWNPRWFKEQKDVRRNGDIPPPCYGTKDSVSSLVPMLTSFTNYQEYIKIIHPLMLLDLWAEVSENLEKGTNRSRLKFNIVVDNKMELNGLTTISCSMPLTPNEESEQVYPRAGDLCQILYPYWDLATSAEKENLLKQGKSAKDLFTAVFAYVDSASKDYSQKGKYYNPFEGNYEFTHGNPMKSPVNQKGPMSCLLKLSVKTKTVKSTYASKAFLKLQVINNIRASLRMFEAVSYLEHIKLCKMILRPCIEDFKLPNAKWDIKLESPELDKSQKIAVAKAAAVCVGYTPKICMIQGPPGTGKTKVIVNIVMQILYPNGERRRALGNKRPRILLCAPSNAGVDEIVERLLHVRREMKKEDRFKMVRCGQFHSMRDTVKGVSLEELVNKDIDRSLKLNTSLESVDVEIATQEAKKRSYIMVLENASSKGQCVDMYKKRLEETIKRINDLKDSKPGAGRRSVGMEKESRKKVLAHADIIATTLTSSFMPHLTEVFAVKYGKSVKFTCCIIDEATQCKEPECLIPLMYGIDRLVMVGDPEQLPATVLSKTAREKSFGQSLFNRIWNKFQNETDNPVLFLNTQYRMHPEIYEWPNTYIYHGQVKSVPSLLQSGPLKPYCVFSVPFKHTSGLSLCNDGEARFVSEIALSIATILPDIVTSVGIITPYQKQVNIIKNFVRGRTTETSIAVNTIDGFQGQECDVIIFSCVRSHGVGFMGESQRLNVALTRARHSMIICGNFKSLKEDKMWASLLNDAARRGVVTIINEKQLDREEILRCILKS